MQSVEIFDKFGCRLHVGDWVLYTPIRTTTGAGLRYSQVTKIRILIGSMAVVYLDNEEDDIAHSHNCVKFSLEEVTVRRLESDR